MSMPIGPSHTGPGFGVEPDATVGGVDAGGGASGVETTGDDCCDAGAVRTSAAGSNGEVVGARASAERAGLASIDHGYDTYVAFEKSGGTARANRVFEKVADIIDTGWFDWKVTTSEKKEAGDLMATLSPAEFLNVASRLNKEQLIDPINGGYHTKSGFLFHAGQKAMTEGKIEDIKGHFQQELADDPKALDTALSIFKAQHENLWPQ
jgi:hypothetical protein